MISQFTHTHTCLVIHSPSQFMRYRYTLSSHVVGVQSSERDQTKIYCFVWLKSKDVTLAAIGAVLTHRDITSNTRARARTHTHTHTKTAREGKREREREIPNFTTQKLSFQTRDRQLSRQTEEDGPSKYLVSSFQICHHHVHFIRPAQIITPSHQSRPV